MVDKKQTAQPGRSTVENLQSGKPSAADFQKRLQEAYFSYLKELQLVQADYQQGLAQVYIGNRRHWQEVVQSAPDPEKCLEAYRSNAQALQKFFASPEPQQRIEEAYLQYLRALREAWSQVDFSALSPGAGSV